MARRRHPRAPPLGASSAAEDLVGQPLPDPVSEENRPLLEAAIAGFELTDPRAEWIGQGVRAEGTPFQAALTAAVVRHADRSVYRVRWSLRDIGRRPQLD